MASSTGTEKAAKEHISPTLADSTHGAKSLDAGPSLRCSVTGASVIVMMGVSGTGKSTLGEALAGALRVPFIDGDDLHPTENVAKMARGEPLGDADRWPWLERVRRTAVACAMAQVGERAANRARSDDGESDEGHRPGVVVACSALKKTYRAMLRGEGVPPQTLGCTSGGAPLLPTYFVYLKGDRDVLMARMQCRQGHFMKAGMLESQLDTLESPEGEPGVVSVSVEMSMEEQVQKVVQVLGSSS